MTLEEYQKVNNSFNKVCVYRIGNEAGFFSEINNMLIAMIFCLENRLQFRLYSTGSNFGEDIWKDYLLPFTKHSTARSHFLYNERPYIHKRPYPFTIEELFSIKKTLAKQFLTQDIWPYIRNKNLYNADYYVDSQYLKGDLIEVASKLIKCIWNYNSYSKNKIAKLIYSLNISGNYAAIFVRRGDKSIEASHTDVKKYFDEIDKLTDIENYPVFIGSDDYRVIEEAKCLYPNRPIYSFDFQGDKGYIMNEFLRNNTKEEQKLKIVQLLAQVEMMNRSTYFVGTYSKNVGVFVGRARNCNNSHDVNGERWALW